MPNDMSSIERQNPDFPDIQRPKLVNRPQSSDFLPNQEPRHMLEANPAGGSGGRKEGLNGEQWATWLIPDGKDDDDFKKTPQEVGILLQRIARRPDTMVNQKFLEDAYSDIEKLVGSNNITDADVAMWLSRIGDRHQHLTNPNTPSSNTPQGDQKAFADALAEALYGERLSQYEKYVEILDDEQWNNDPIPPINPDSPPAFYVEMTREERERHQIRIELANACYIKRNKLSAPTLEAMSKEIPYAGLTKSETQRLYENTPGVKEAIKEYIKLIDGGDILIMGPKGRDKLLETRQEIRRRIKDDVINDFNRIFSRLSPEDQQKYKERYFNDLANPDYSTTLDLKCRDAEQIAFNILYLGNVFESLDSQWQHDANDNPTVRQRAPQITSELLIIPIRNAMKPLDNLIASLGKDEKEYSPVGKLGEWARVQTLEANNKKPIILDPSKVVAGNQLIDRIEIIEEERKNKNEFWAIENRGGNRVLMIPECYPDKIIGSIFEETKVKSTKKPLIDYIRDSHNGDIPWEDVGEDMWGNYGFRLGKANQVWDFLQGKVVIRWGEYENVGLWAQDVNNALAQFDARNDKKIKRWILYASTGINPNRRAPTLRNSNNRMQISFNLGSRAANYLGTSRELFFPWDGFGRYF